MDQFRDSIKKQEEKKPIIDMVAFRNEKNEEIEGMMDLLSINPEYLTEKDAYMWERVKSHGKNPITRIELEQYREDVKNSQRFESLITQKLSSVWLSEEQKNIENSKLKK